SIVDRFDREGRITSKPRGGDKKSILNEQHKNFLEEAIEQEPWITIADLIQELVDQFPNLQLSDRTVARYIRNMGFTLKRLTVVPEGRNSDDTIQKRKQYVERIYNENINIYSDMVYIDETGFNLHLSTLRGRARHGQPAIRKVVNNRRKNISVIAAINEDGVLHYKSILGSVNEEILTTFINELNDIIPSGKFLVMDNVRFHRTDVIKEAIENTIHEIFYLPPYSPFLNPIENCFSKVKNSVARIHLRNRETILGRINDAFNIVTEEDCKGWIRHTSSYFQPILGVYYFNNKYDNVGNENELVAEIAASIFRAAALSGASTRIHEVLELCDRIEQDYVGKGLLRAADLDVKDQKTVDEFLLKLDNIPNKSNLGANAIPGISFGVTKAGATKKPILLEVKNLMFFLYPFSIIKIGSEVYHSLKSVIKSKYDQDATNVSDEGDFAPNIQDNKECFKLLKDAIKKLVLTIKIEGEY
ncbi:7312_t:CDS:2, partial [Cetraspora pellucida]